MRRLLEFVSCIDSRDDDCDIFRGDVGRVFRKGDWLVHPRRGETDDVP